MPEIFHSVVLFYILSVFFYFKSVSSLWKIAAASALIRVSLGANILPLFPVNMPIETIFSTLALANPETLFRSLSSEAFPLAVSSFRTLLFTVIALSRIAAICSLDRKASCRERV